MLIHPLLIVIVLIIMTPAIFLLTLVLGAFTIPGNWTKEFLLSPSKKITNAVGVWCVTLAVITTGLFDWFLVYTLTHIRN